MKYFVSRDGLEFEVVVADAVGGGYDLVIDGRALHADCALLKNEDFWSIIIGGRSYDFLLDGSGERLRVVHPGLTAEFRVESERERNARRIGAEPPQAAGDIVKAVMPGIVVAVHTAEGKLVQKGDALVVLEAMKMENEIRATAGGIVARVNVAAGQTVSAGDVLVEIVPA